MLTSLVHSIVARLGRKCVIMTLLSDPVAFNSPKNKNRGSIAEDCPALCGRVSLDQKTGQGNFRL
jgi:hypothetical protein